MKSMLRIHVQSPQQNKNEHLLQNTGFQFKLHEAGSKNYSKRTAGDMKLKKKKDREKDYSGKLSTQNNKLSNNS